MRAFLQEKPENPHGFHFVAPSRSSEKGPAPERPAFSGGAPGPLADKLPGPSPRPGEGGGPRRHFWGLLRWGRAGFAGKGVGLAGRTSSPRNRSGRLPALPPAGTAPAGAGSRRRDPPAAPSGCRQARPRCSAGKNSLRFPLQLPPPPRSCPSPGGQGGREAAPRPHRGRGCSPGCCALRGKAGSVDRGYVQGEKDHVQGAGNTAFAGLPALQKPRDLQRGWEEDTPLVLNLQ